jgi:hypothetical protein
MTTQTSTDSESGSPSPAGIVAIPAETLLAWVNAAALIPAGYGAELFLSMRAALSTARGTPE